jgi:hypothetical protein
MCTGDSFPGVKWQAREADHSPPSSAEFNPLKPNGNYMSHLLQQSISFYIVESDRKVTQPILNYLLMVAI